MFLPLNLVYLNQCNVSHFTSIRSHFFCIVLNEPKFGENVPHYQVVHCLVFAIRLVQVTIGWWLIGATLPHSDNLLSKLRNEVKFWFVIQARVSHLWLLSLEEWLPNKATRARTRCWLPDYWLSWFSLWLFLFRALRLLLHFLLGKVIQPSWSTNRLISILTKSIRDLADLWSESMQLPFLLQLLNLLIVNFFLFV